MSNILQELESQIAGIKTAATRSNVGVVREIGDGAAKVEGLSDVTAYQPVEQPGQIFLARPPPPVLAIEARVLRAVPGIHQSLAARGSPPPSVRSTRYTGRRLTSS